MTRYDSNYAVSFGLLNLAIEHPILPPGVLLVVFAARDAYVAVECNFIRSAEPPRTVALLPYAIFSLFHALTFTRTTLMPQFLPPGPPAQQGAAPTPHPLAKKLQVWVKSESFLSICRRTCTHDMPLANYDNAMRAVAFTELAIMIRVVIGALTLRTSLISPVIYAHFLRQRWYQSKFTREAFALVHDRISKFVNSPGKPPVLAQVYNQAAGLAGKWANTPNGAAAAGAGARRQ